MIEVRDVRVRVGTAVLLDGVSVDVAPGELVAVVGPNGAGKSTLLRTMTGELVPTSGQVHMDGRPLAEWSLRDRARVRAVVPQESTLSFPFSAYEVVLLGRAPHLDGQESLLDRTIARLAMSAMDTLELEDRPFPTLSGGEKQRVNAARAWAQLWDRSGPRALFLDEPTASLDLAHAHGLLRQAKRMTDNRCAVVCILHDLNLAAQYANRLVVLSGGRVVREGTPSEVLSRELLAEVFGVDALVLTHPGLACPLVVPTGPSREREMPTPLPLHPSPFIPTFKGETP